MADSWDVNSGDETTLAVPINSTQTTSIQFAAMTINGSTLSWATTGGGIVEISESVDGTIKREWINFTGGSTTNNIFTPSGVTRGVDRDAATRTTATAGQTFNKGARVRLVVSHLLLNQKADVDRANTFSAGVTQTFNGLISPSTVTFTTDGDEFFTLPSLTTAERDSLSAVEGMIIYNETTSQVNSYEGGAWVTSTSGSVSNGSTTVAGKFEEATTAEQGAATATGGTGARLIPAVANLVKTSSGSGDENKIALLNSSGKFASGFIDSSGDLTGFYGDASDGNVTLGSNTTLTSDMFYDTLDLSTYTLTTDGYRVFARTITGTGEISWNGNGGGDGADGVGGETATQGTGGSGGTAGGALSGNILPGAVVGVAGGAGGLGGDPNGAAGSAGAAGTDRTDGVASTNGSAGAAGGAGETKSGTGGAGGAAGAAGSTTQVTAKVNSYHNFLDWIYNTAGASPEYFYGIAGGGASGGGGGGGRAGGGSKGSGGGGGGGSGSNGGNILVVAHTMTGSFNINALGGDGGDGGQSATPISGDGGVGGGGAGGSGGSGGAVCLIKHLNSAWSGSISVAGGAAGAGGAAIGSGGAGTIGNAGATGFSATFSI